MSLSVNRYGHEASGDISFAMWDKSVPLWDINRARPIFSMLFYWLLICYCKWLESCTQEVVCRAQIQQVILLVLYNLRIALLPWSVDLWSVHRNVLTPLTIGRRMGKGGGGEGGWLLDLRKGLENGTGVSFGGIWCVFEGSFDLIVEGTGGVVEEFVSKRRLSRPSSCAATQRWRTGCFWGGISSGGYLGLPGRNSRECVWGRAALRGWQ